MVAVALPARATIGESYQLIRTCTVLERERGPVDLDCSETVMLGPFGIALLASSIAIRRISDRETRVIRPRDEGANRFLSEVGFDKFARGEVTGHGTLEVRQMLALDAVYVDQAVGLLTEWVPGMTKENSYPIQVCMNELLQNVFEWAESPIGCTVLTRAFRPTQSVTLTVVDRGIGIPAALRRAQIRNLHRKSDAEVLFAAVRSPQLTSRKNPHGGGLGLKTIHDIVCQRSGRLTVIALTGKVAWSARRFSKFKSPALRGTAVEIDVRPEALRPKKYTEVF